MVYELHLKGIPLGYAYAREKKHIEGLVERLREKQEFLNLDLSERPRDLWPEMAEVREKDTAEIGLDMALGQTVLERDKARLSIPLTQGFQAKTDYNTLARIQKERPLEKKKIGELYQLNRSNGIYVLADFVPEEVIDQLNCLAVTKIQRWAEKRVMEAYLEWQQELDRQYTAYIPHSNIYK